MRKNKLLLLLVLLITAATGAWAQDAKHLITATYVEKTRSLEQPLPYATTIGELYEAVTGEPFSDLLSRMSALEMPLKGISSTKTDVVSIGELNGASTPVTVTADGKATVALRFGDYAQGIFVSVVPPLYVTMADGTEDAAKWTASTDGTNFGTLPIGGLKDDGSETVTLKYNGRLKVKSVTATTDAPYAANEYNEAEWNYDKVVFTKKAAASVTPVTNSDTDVTWGAGWYTVSGNVTINGKVTLGANTHLILQDGATLTINGQLNASYDLYIYGQMEGTGKLNVTCNDNAIEGSKFMTTNIHGGEITATATGDSHHGLYFGKIMMYSGKLTATAADYGIGSNTFGINVYGGEVEGIANAASDTHHGIKCDGTLMVYGGKVKGTGNANGQGIVGKIKSSTSNIKFYFHADGATWGDGAYYGDAVEAPAIRYAKAE